MRNRTIEFLNRIVTLHRYTKRIIVIIIDGFLCVLCTWLAYSLRLEKFISFEDFNLYPALISIVISIPIFWVFGLYRTIFRYAGLSFFLNILSSSFVYGIFYFFIITVYKISSNVPYLANVPRSIGILQPMLLFFSIIFSRIAFKYLLNINYNFRRSNNKKNVMIYGAGDAGRQLFISLENSPEFKVVGFLDDNIELKGRHLLGQTIYSSFNLENLFRKQNVSLIFLALPTVNRNKRNEIIEKLNRYKLIVKTLPSVSEIVDGKVTISDIKDFSIDDLLNREQIKPNIDLLNKNINSKIVLVTGAGGSIGSELCRQIVKLQPNKLLLLELNEFLLYKIYEELISFNLKLKILPLIVNAQDQPKLEKILETFKVDTIYHAAAYKHVPLVEENICEGVKNNVYSTLAIANASVLKNVSNLVLVSSDKAVRPTNIMGASKRLAELCMQGIYNDQINTIKTNFSIVRFGNVLESSGSVIPKFKKQIKEGGPVTLTHEDITRYFMTLTEAAQLVIQAGSMGKKSEVFVLDMGHSVKIKDLIYKMISLSGLSIKNSKNPDGDIEIKITGLRPGEKLFEELLIGDKPKKTSHPKIMMTSDPFIPFSELKIELDNLKSLLDENKAKEVKFLLEKILKSYNSNSRIVDHIYVEKLLKKKL